MVFNIEAEFPAIPNINALLSDQERQARLLLMDKIIMYGSPVKSDEFQENYLLHRLETRGVIVRDKDAAVSVVCPVSALPTPHKVKLKDSCHIFLQLLPKAGFSYD